MLFEGEKEVDLYDLWMCSVEYIIHAVDNSVIDIL